MANIIPLKEESGAQFYPQTHEKAVIDSNGVNLQTKLANITTPSYVTAWDGVSTPVVANIPAGVVVTYNSTDYTGTLAASASTLNKTYLVATGTANNYYRYVTELSGSSYSWHSIGTTEINLSDYATKEELSQLSQEKLDKSNLYQIDPWNLAEGATIIEQKYFNSSGELINSVNFFIVSGIAVTPGETIYFYCQLLGETYNANGYDNKNTAREIRYTTSGGDVSMSGNSYNKSPFVVPSDVVKLDIAFQYTDNATMSKGTYWVTRKAADAHTDTENMKESFKEEILGDIPSDIDTLAGIVEDVTTLKNNLVIDKDVEMVSGYLNTSTGEFISSTGNQKTTGYISLEVGPIYTLDFSGAPDQTTPRAICIYDDSKTFTRALNVVSIGGFALAPGERYIRINTNATEIYTLDLYPNIEGRESQILNPELRSPALDEVKEAILPTRGGNYLHARRPTVAFIIDGLHEYNDDRRLIFERHGYRIGFALGWTTFGAQFVVSNKAVLLKYLGLQDNGHEILTHLYYILNENTTYDDATAIGYIKQSIDVMSGVGFKVRGAIGSSGAVATRFLPVIKNCYTWAATANNPSGEAISYFSFGEADPYVLSRYSMQLSTVAQQKAAIDSAIANNGLLLFYGHAESVSDYFNNESLEEVLTYLDTKVADHQCQVLLPSDAVSDYFSLRYQDLYSPNM